MEYKTLFLISRAPEDSQNLEEYDLLKCVVLADHAIQAKSIVVDFQKHDRKEHDWVNRAECKQLVTQAIDLVAYTEPQVIGTTQHKV